MIERQFSFVNSIKYFRSTTLAKAKVWERYGKVWAIYDLYVGMINIEIWKTYGNKHIAINPMGNLWGYLLHR